MSIGMPVPVEVPTGWVCPCCRRVYSPQTGQCAHCAPAPVFSVLRRPMCKCSATPLPGRCPERRQPEYCWRSWPPVHTDSCGCQEKAVAPAAAPEPPPGAGRPEPRRFPHPVGGLPSEPRRWAYRTGSLPSEPLPLLRLPAYMNSGHGVALVGTDWAAILPGLEGCIGDGADDEGRVTLQLRLKPAPGDGDEPAVA